MYLSVGGGAVLRGAEIVGIFDVDNITRSRDSRRLLASCEKQGRLTSLGEDLPRSLVVTSTAGHEQLYLSPVSPGTLRKRSQ